VTARVLRRGRAGYPPLLAQLYDPPAQLYLRGEADPALLARPAVAIVGARACSSYGAQVARALGRELAAAGVVVVSGLARGIDAEAHRGALEAGTTVAVLGCGIDRDYPRAHAELARRIAAEGLVVSEYGPGVEPAPWRFPARNRIVAGLALATIVVEARERSGARTSRSSSAASCSRCRVRSRAPSRQGRTACSARRPRHHTSVWRTSWGRSDFSGRRLPPSPRPRLRRRCSLSGRPSAEVAAALVELELSGLASAVDGVYRAVAAPGPGRPL
jgi:DNA protecting protein DprA